MAESESSLESNYFAENYDLILSVLDSETGYYKEQRFSNDHAPNPLQMALDFDSDGAVPSTRGSHLVSIPTSFQADLEKENWPKTIDFNFDRSFIMNSGHDGLASDANFLADPCVHGPLQNRSYCQLRRELEDAAAIAFGNKGPPKMAVAPTTGATGSIGLKQKWSHGLVGGSNRHNCKIPFSELRKDQETLPGVIDEGTTNVLPDLRMANLISPGNLFEEKMIPYSRPDPERKKKSAHTPGESAQASKRKREHDYDINETTILLEMKVEALESPETTFKRAGLTSWGHYVSRHNGRSVKSCQGKWDSLKKMFDAVCDHESKVNSGSSRHLSYWQMNEEQWRAANQERSKLKQLPLVFLPRWFELMKRIIQITRKIPDSEDLTESIPVDANPDSSSTQPRLYFPYSDDDLISKIAPFVTYQIEVALKPILSVLGRLEKNDRKQKLRERMLAIEEEKLALEEEEMAIFTHLGESSFTGKKLGSGAGEGGAVDSSTVKID